MRRVSNAVAHVFVVLAVMVVLAAPVQARPNEDGSWRGLTRARIVALLNKLKGGIASFGDMLSDPRP